MNGSHVTKRNDIGKEWPDQVTAELLKELRDLTVEKMHSKRELHLQVLSLAKQRDSIGLVPRSRTTFNKYLDGEAMTTPGLIELIVEVLDGPKNWRQRYNHPDNEEFHQPSQTARVFTICNRDLGRIETVTLEDRLPPSVDRPPTSSVRVPSAIVRAEPRGHTSTGTISRDPKFREYIITALALLILATASTPIPSIHSIQIDPSAYDVNLSEWDRYGPLYEAQMENLARNGATHTHVYGEDVGSFYYTANLSEVGSNGADLSVRLSSDKPQFKAGPTKYSDVTLLVNGEAQPRRRVAPDNGSGTIYTWPIDPSLLKTGFNQIEFRVESDAVFTNGLAIYARAVSADYTDEWITIRTW